MEASALHAPAAIGRLPLASPLLRLRSDDQLVALFRAGSDDAFRVLYDRYRQRLFAYVRQMLATQSRQDAEDVLQDVFVRAFGALRADSREVNVRAWLYRVAHNRCIDHLRRPVPPAAEIFEMSRKPLHDPVAESQRRDDLRRLVADVARLPAQQRSALLMREIDGMSYADLAAALDVTVPAVKSLLVRARIGLVEAQEARDTDCAEIRRDLHASYDRGVKASGRARRHMRECAGCREYRGALRGMRRSFAALVPPATVGPLALVAKLLGVGGAGGGAAAAGTAGAGAGAGVSAGGLAAAGGAAACKVAAVVCATAITAGGAAEVRRLTQDAPIKERTRPAEKARAHAAAAPAAATAHVAAMPAPVPSAPALETSRAAQPAADARAPRRRTAAAAAPVVRAEPTSRAGLPAAETPAAPAIPASGGIAAPDPAVVAVPAGETAPDAAAEPVPDTGVVAPAETAVVAPADAPAAAAEPVPAPAATDEADAPAEAPSAAAPPRRISWGSAEPAPRASVEPVSGGTAPPPPAQPADPAGGVVAPAPTTSPAAAPAEPAPVP